ncbi:MAG: hypothetical protein HY736_04100 [Verrucomicrobia bacterium]|nr:hypothetical protein [Verrucomicrobiota bacterium]
MIDRARLYTSRFALPMKTCVLNRPLALFLLFVGGLGRIAATTIDPLLWQQLANRADLIGVVECVTAGGNVARYRVTEVWKGEVRAGEVVSIRIATDYWGARYAVTLVGQRFFVTAFKNNAPGRIMSTTIGGAVPAWWRNIPCDYSLPLYQGAVALDRHSHEGEDSFHKIGSERSRLADVRDDFRGYLALSEQERAMTLLRVLAAKYLERPWADGKTMSDLSAAVKRAKTHDETIETLIKAWDSGTEHDNYRTAIEMIIGQATALTRRRAAELARTPQDSAYVLKPGETLYKFATARFGHTAYAYHVFDGNRDVIDAIDEPRPGVVLQLYSRRRLMNACLEFKFSPPSRPPSKAATAAEIATAGRQFATHSPESPEHADAAELLIVHDPEPVVKWLKAWKAPARDWRDTDRGYVLGSSAAARCGGDRVHFLTELLWADDPHIQVAAAVHLAFEDEAKGREALRKLSELPGDPGAWAALTLVRYGERAAVTRAAETLSARHDDLTAGSLLRPLVVSRLLEVVSNTAAAHNLPTPAWLGDKDAAARIQEFFVRNPDITPVDPWLPELRRQKID